MRVAAQNALGHTAATAPSARRAASGTFALATGDEPRPAGGGAAPRAVAGIDALIALQAVEEPAERRRRAVRHGRKTLDALDALKLGVVVGTLDAAALRVLAAAAETPAEGSGDPGLDAVLGEIALRAAVELAKYGDAGGRP